jgi:hypothetical protein
VREFYDFLKVTSDEEMARHLNMDLDDLKKCLAMGRTPWEHLIPALSRAGMAVEVYLGNFQLGRVQDPDKIKDKPLPTIKAKIDYNQMLELRRKKILK